MTVFLVAQTQTTIKKYEKVYTPEVANPWQACEKNSKPFMELKSFSRKKFIFHLKTKFNPFFVIKIQYNENYYILLKIKKKK